MNAQRTVMTLKMVTPPQEKWEERGCVGWVEPKASPPLH
jgi:hypothetical protein